jgi:pyruvate/2-oxoglutarate/acetoin dehydrogenase E1 component
MAEFYFSVNLDNDRTLCVAPLSDRRIALSGQDIRNRGGYFLFEQRGSEEFGRVEIIAHIVSEEAAFRLREMFNME